MSNFTAVAFNPKSGMVEEATWLDGHFGAHTYGIQFADGEIYRTTDVDLEAISRHLAAKDKRIAELESAAQEAKLQIEYLHGKFGVTGSGNGVLARIDAALSGDQS